MARRRKPQSLESLLVSMIVLTIGYVYVLPRLLVIMNPGRGLEKHLSNPVAINVWPYVIIAIGLLVIITVSKILYAEFVHCQLSRTGILEIDGMDGKQFEKRLIVLFRNLGYKTEHTGHTGDYGVDLVIEKDGTRIAVQAKRYKNYVPEKAVQEAYSSIKVHNCTEGWVVTNNYFSEYAKTLAKINNVRLIDRDELIRFLTAEKAVS